MDTCALKIACTKPSGREASSHASHSVTSPDGALDRRGLSCNKLTSWVRACVAGVVLDNSSNNFERGRTDEFTIRTGDLGNLVKLLVSCDGSGCTPDWYLEQVVMKDSKHNAVVTFPYDAWISKKVGLEQVR